MEGYTPQPREDTELHYNAVSRDYFSTMQIPVIAGRTFDQSDTQQSAPVVIVNEILAKRYFGGNAVGRRLVTSGSTGWRSSAWCVRAAGSPCRSRRTGRVSTRSDRPIARHHV